MMGWSRAGQTDPVFSQAKADAMQAEAAKKGARARDMEAVQKPSLWSRLKGLFKKTN